MHSTLQARGDHLNRKAFLARFGVDPYQNVSNKGMPKLQSLRNWTVSEHYQMLSDGATVHGADQ